MRKSKKHQWRIRFDQDINPRTADDVVDETFDTHETAVEWVYENMIYPREAEAELVYGEPGYDEAYDALISDVWDEVTIYNVADDDAAEAVWQAHLAKIAAEKAAKKAEERAKMPPEEREYWDWYDKLSPDEQLALLKRLFNVA